MAWKVFQTDRLCRCRFDFCQFLELILAHFVHGGDHEFKIRFCVIVYVLEGLFRGRLCCLLYGWALIGLFEVLRIVSLSRIFVLVLLLMLRRCCLRYNHFKFLKFLLSYYQSSMNHLQNDPQLLKNFFTHLLAYCPTYYYLKYFDAFFLIKFLWLV